MTNRTVTYLDFTNTVVTAKWVSKPLGHLEIRDGDGNKVGNEPLMSAEGYDSWVAGLKTNFPECVIAIGN